VADRGRYHRDQNPQSVPVAELLAANKRIRNVEPEQELFVDALLQREQSSGPVTAPQPAVVPVNRSRYAPLVLGVAAAAVVLAGALVATQTMSRPDEAGSKSAPAATPEHITGAKVFKPDVIRATLNTNRHGARDRHTKAGHVGTGSPDHQAQHPTDQGVPGAVAGGEPAPAQPGTISATTPRTTQPTGPLLGGTPPATTTNQGGLLDPITGPILGPILGFYSTAPAQPAQAYHMLAPSIQDGTADEFARSWDGVMNVQVQEATPDGPNSMVVRVSLLRVDGTWLVTQQRIVVGSGTAPMIVDAQLLSVSLG
jgi:hypothetical protein